MAERPHDLFDREAEWSDLVAFAEQQGAGTRLGLVRGRRRQGKSFLLRRLARAVGGFYYQAVEQEPAQALDALGTALGRYLKVPGGRLAFADWDQAVTSITSLRPGITSLRSGDAPALVVIDEFPYLSARSPDLASIVQRGIDASRDEGPAVRLIVCGSALSVMANLLVGTQALRGRASHDITVRTFDYRTAARFWGIEDPRAAFQVHAVLGGTPGYRDLVTTPPPRRLGDIGRWLEHGVLNPASALFREDDYLLTEERSLSDRALYHAVAGAIAAGATSQAKVAAALGRPGQAVQYPLKALEDAGFVGRADDLLRSRRPIYHLNDPIVRFHHVVTRRDLARFEDRRFAAAWADAQPRFSTHILGPHFEELARQFAFRFAAPSTIGGPVSDVGPAVVNDARARARHELDVVVRARLSSGATEVTAIGEAKHTRRPRGVADLERLEHIRGLLNERGQVPAATKLLLFSVAGFSAGLVGVADQRDDVELISLDRMYEGE